MACYHPLLALCVGTKANGKADLKFLSYRPLDSDKVIYYNGQIYPRAALVKLPCGQCIGCRLDYSREWANRCMLELQYHDSAYFCTFTYNEDHVPRSYYSDPDTGEAFQGLTLCKRDFQLFMKRLRKRFSDDAIRFFACGEYGSSTFRPHYHAILFGLHLDDLCFYKQQRLGDQIYNYYTSESLQRCWSDSDGNPIGYVVVGNVTWETCAYTARYITKKLKGQDAIFYDLHNITPEFTLMSRKPGIARFYYDDHGGDIYEYDKINISTPKGGRSFRPPRYFDKLFDIECPVESAELKAQRAQLAKAAQAAKLANTSLDSYELQQVEESTFANKVKKLRRPLL